MRKALLKITTIAAAAVLAAAPAMAAQVPASPQAVSPRLAPGVKPQAGYEAVTERYVVGNPTPIYSDIVWTSPTTGSLDKVGEPINAIAKVKDWNWLLIGRDGVGVGYVSGDLMQATPAKSARK